MNCKKCKNMFVEAAYGDFEPEQQQAFEQHLASCQPCATAFREMQATLQVMAQREKAPANTEFLDSLWAQINPEIDQQPSSTRTGKLPHLAPFLQSKWLFGLTAAAALFALGIFVGRLVFSTAPPAEEFAQRHSGAVSEAHYQQIEQRSARYLERSKVLLLGIINHEPVEADSGILNLDYKKKLSQQLVMEADVLKNDLTDSQQHRLQKLVADIEMILLQIANLEETQDLPAVEMIRSSVDRKGIMLKINLEKMKTQHPYPDFQTDSQPKIKI